MARRNRRRRRYTWFPNLGTDPQADGLPHKRLSGVNFSLALADPAGPTYNRAIIPLTFDQPINEAEVAMTTPGIRLSALQGSSWFLRRVVGSLQVARGWVALQGGQPRQPALLFGAALAVVPWDEYSNTPEADVNPLLAEDINEPWIWRRTLLLGAQNVNSGFSLSPNANALLTFPVNSSFHPQSRFEMLDQKTMRLINGDERLCLVVSVAPLTSVTLGDDEDTIIGYFDYRLLGGLRRRSNRGGTVN